MLRRLLGTVLVTTMVAAGAAPAQTPDAQSIPPDLRWSRPDADGPPTRVAVSLLVIDIIDLDTVTEAFTVEFLLDVRWTDPRLAAAELGRSDNIVVDLDRVWHAGIHLGNARVVRKALPEQVEIDAAGNVRYRQYFFGTLSSQLHLEQLPFDRQTLAIRFFVLDERDEVRIEIDPGQSGVYKRLDLSGWDIEDVRFSATEEVIDSRLRSMSIVECTLAVKRRLGFYFWRLFLPLGLIVFMAYAVFWIDPSSFGPQMAVSTSAVFSLIAFQLSTRSVLPPISYITKADMIVFSAMTLVFVALGEAVITGRLAKQGHLVRGERIDRMFRWLFPTVAAVIVMVILVI